MIRNRVVRSLVVVFILLVAVGPVFAAPSFPPWGLAASLESIPGTSTELNTPAQDGCPILSRNGLQLYMASTRPGGQGGIDIWVAERSSSQEPFGTPVNAGVPINGGANDFCPSPMRDGQGFMFVSTRPDGCGGSDIYMTRYNPEKGWQAPENLGCDINSSADEAGPVLVYAEVGPPTLFFSSNRVDSSGGMDLYQSRMVGGWKFGAADLVSGVNSEADDMQPYVRRDGLEIVFASNRAGGLGSFDIWSATRDSITDPWATPVNLGANVNSVASESRPSLSWDGSMLLFGTARAGIEGVSDIFFATR